MKQIKIYTDGACSGNPGPGGWAAILMYNGTEKILSGNASDTTNNRMELTAIIRALAALTEPCNVTVYTDSAYSVNPIALGWLEKWRRSDWKGSSGKVKNIDLWKRLTALASIHSVNFVKVKGHADDANNNRCDKIARDEIKKLSL